MFSCTIFLILTSLETLITFASFPPKPNLKTLHLRVWQCPGGISGPIRVWKKVLAVERWAWHSFTLIWLWFPENSEVEWIVSTTDHFHNCLDQSRLFKEDKRFVWFLEILKDLTELCHRPGLPLAPLCWEIRTSASRMVEGWLDPRKASLESWEGFLCMGAGRTHERGVYMLVGLGAGRPDVRPSLWWNSPIQRASASSCLCLELYPVFQSSALTSIVWHSPPLYARVCWWCFFRPHSNLSLFRGIMWLWFGCLMSVSHIHVRTWRSGLGLFSCVLLLVRCILLLLVDHATKSGSYPWHLSPWPSISNTSLSNKKPCYIYLQNTSHFCLLLSISTTSNTCHHV